MYYRLQSVIDLLGLIASWYATVELRLFLNSYMRLQFSRQELYGLAPPLSAVVLLWVLTEFWLRTYRPKPTNYVGGAFVSAVEAVAVASTLTIVVTFFSRQFGADMSRSFVILFVPMALVILFGPRGLGLRRVRAQHAPGQGIFRGPVRLQAAVGSHPLLYCPIQGPWPAIL